MGHPDTRAARRALARKHRGGGGTATPRSVFQTKHWGGMCLRRNKVHRAAKLGKLWPHPQQKMEALMAETLPVNVLFVCSRNAWRSPTGEAVYRRVPGVVTRSAGTSRAARRQVTLADIRWADLILVMEDKHAQRLRAAFRQDLRYKALHVLDIPDDFTFMDPALVTELEARGV